MTATTPIPQRRSVNVKNTRIILRNSIIQIIITSRSQLILTSTHTIRVIAAAALDPDVHVIGRAARAETVEDEEFLEVGRVSDLALLEVPAGLEGDGEGVVEGAVPAGDVVAAEAVVGGVAAVAARVVTIIGVAEEGELGFLTDVVSLLDVRRSESHGWEESNGEGGECVHDEVAGTLGENMEEFRYCSE
jgi:hypothetical protein